MRNIPSDSIFLDALLASIVALSLVGQEKILATYHQRHQQTRTQFASSNDNSHWSYEGDVHTQSPVSLLLIHL